MGILMIKRWMGSVAVLPVFIAAPALAAPPVYNWTGFYVGANAGGTWGQFGSNLGVDCSVPGSPPSYICWPGFAGDGTTLAAAGYGTINASGFTGGVQAGYNWQTGNIVAGIESDFGAFHLRATRVVSGELVNSWGGTNYTLTSSAGTDWLFTFRGRLGFAMAPNLLGYVTGGLAVTRIGTSTSYSDNNTAIGPVSGSFNDSGTKLGYAIGGGAEYALPGNWTVKAEYLYLGFGNVAAAGVITTTDGAYRQALSTLRDLTAHVGRVGINRRF
jgi:outer membrane immunogenic protein